MKTLTQKLVDRRERIHRMLTPSKKRYHYFVPCKNCGITLDIVGPNEPQLCVDCE